MNRVVGTQWPRSIAAKRRFQSVKVTLSSKGNRSYCRCSETEISPSIVGRSVGTLIEQVTVDFIPGNRAPPPAIALPSGPLSRRCCGAIGRLFAGLTQLGTRKLPDCRDLVEFWRSSRVGNDEHEDAAARAVTFGALAVTSWKIVPCACRRGFPGRGCWPG